MRRLLYLVTAITLIGVFGVISIGCMCSSPPSNAAIKKAIIAYEGSSGNYLTEADIEVLKVGSARMVPQLPPITVYPVTLSIKGQERHYLLQKLGSEWSAALLP